MNDEKYNIDDLKCCANCIGCDLYNPAPYNGCVCNRWGWDKITKFERRQSERQNI